MTASSWNTLTIAKCSSRQKLLTSRNCDRKLGKRFCFLALRRNKTTILINHRLASSQIEEYIVKDNFPGTEDYFVKFEEFVNRLKIPADDYSYTLFKMFVNPTQISKDVIDFQQYLLHALLLIKIREAKIELVKLLFLVSFLN